jgi:phosphoesterase RecJ-like protein
VAGEPPPPISFTQLMKPNCRLDEIADVLRNRQRFVVMSHMRPDGDAYGCELAMALCLKQLGKDVTVWNEDGVLDKYAFMPGSEMITKPPAEPQEFDVAIALDTAVQNRVGTCLSAVKHADTWINMDHHVSNDRYGDLVYIDPKAPAAGEILFEFFSGQNLPITPAMADNLYVAISTDTGCFQYPSTTARTYEIGAELVRMGVNVGKLSQAVYENNPRRRLELLRALLNVTRFTSNDKVASFHLSLQTAKALGVLPEDNEGLIDNIRSVEGVIVAAFFEELADNKVRISLRSKDPRADVCKVCALFGGGGHTLAAGARIAGSLDEVQEKVLAAIDREVSSF